MANSNNSQNSVLCRRMAGMEETDQELTRRF
jgi:hypothetical protein